MAQSRHPQFRLFDLVMWVLLACLLFSFGRLFMRIPELNDSLPWPVILHAIGVGLWVAVWSTVRAKRTGPVCQECGRRFVAHGTLANSTLCASCRPASLPPAQRGREQITNLLALLFAATFL